MIIGFYKEYGELGYLATYSDYGFIKDGIFYRTSEHYYQSKKFADKDVINKIILAPTPKIASQIGRDRKNKLRKNWDLIKNDVMYEATLYKFLANEEIRERLLLTQNNSIVEETVKENYWGCGPNKDGKNCYGKILELVRKKIRRINMEKYYVTREGYEKLLEEYYNIDKLYTETTKAMGKSDEMDSDLRENPEYMELRVKAMYAIPRKKKELFEQLNNSVIIEDTEEFKNWDKETVITKCRVSLVIDGEIEIYDILGANESNFDQNILSCEAPLVKALLGHKKGDMIIFNDIKIKIQNIEEIVENSKKRSL